MKYYLSLALVLFYHSLLYSQPLVEVKAEANDKGDVEFTCSNRGFSNYIIEISFSSLQNLKTDFKPPYTATVRPGANTLFRLKREIENQSTNFSYKVRYTKGCLNSKVNMEHTYLLPVAPGKQTSIDQLEYFLKRFANEPEPTDWYAVSVKMKAGDTVFASRRGTVCGVKDDAKLNQSGYAMASTDNFVEVSHDDCSFARYQVFTDKQIFVKPGQFVEAGDPLGIVGGEKYLSGPHVRFCVYYVKGKEAFKELDKGDASASLAYVPLQFWAKDVGKMKLQNHSMYISEHPADLVTKEMSKREVKKWNDRHKLK